MINYWSSWKNKHSRLPDLSNKDMAELWECYQDAVAKNLPPLDTEPFPDELDQDLPRWIAFHIQLRLIEILPYDSSFPLEEAIKALGYVRGNDDKDYFPWAKVFPDQMMLAYRDNMAPASKK